MNPKRGNIVRMMKEAGIIDPSPYVGAWENQLLAQERFAHLVIADFLVRTGQYITNDASREAALNQARTDEREACAKACLEEAKAWPYPSHANAAATMCSMRIRALEVKPS